MALSIKEKNGIFEVNGNLSASNSYQVRKYFEVMLEMKKQIKICLANLDSMVIRSVFEMRALILYALRRGRLINFIGEQNGKIRGAFLGAGFNPFIYENSGFQN